MKNIIQLMVVFSIYSFFVSFLWVSSSLVIVFFSSVVIISMSAMMMFFLFNTPWFFYIVVLSIVGGFMVLLSFVIMTSPNSSGQVMTGVDLTCMFWTIIFITIVIYNLHFNPYYVTVSSVFLTSGLHMSNFFFAYPFVLLLLFLVVLLLIMLFIIDYIVVTDTGSMLV